MQIDAPYSEEVVRPARKDDAPAIARLADIGSDGLAGFFWSVLAASGETTMDVGTRRAAREHATYSYRNAHVAEVEGCVVGLMLGYHQPPSYQTAHVGELPAVIRPLIELEAKAPHSWYVNFLVVAPEYRGRRIGRKLLTLAESIARDSGATEVSIIGLSGNRVTRGIYERAGYLERARATRLDGRGDAGHWVLHVKTLTQEAPPAGP